MHHLEEGEAGEDAHGHEDGNGVDVVGRPCLNHPDGTDKQRTPCLGDDEENEGEGSAEGRPPPRQDERPVGHTATHWPQ